MEILAELIVIVGFQEASPLLMKTDTSLDSTDVLSHLDFTLESGSEIEPSELTGFKVFLLVCILKQTRTLK